MILSLSNCMSCLRVSNAENKSSSISCIGIHYLVNYISRHIGRRVFCVCYYYKEHPNNYEYPNLPTLLYQFHYYIIILDFIKTKFF